MPTLSGRIGLLQLVVIPSTDQQRTKGFYEDLGFALGVDAPFGDGDRWIELYPSEASKTGVAIVPAGEGETPKQTGIIFDTDDIDATHAEMRNGGIDTDPAVAREGSGVEVRIGAVLQIDPVPPMFYFRDPDGNEMLMVEPHLG